MVAVAGGSYRIGCRHDDVGCYPDEKPEHVVELLRFAVMVREVTAAEYDECVAAGKCGKAGKGKACNWQRSDRDEHPINCVGWADAGAYCRFRGYRLPTELEWEAAARGAGHPTYPWGDEAASCAHTVMAGAKKAGCDTGTTLVVGSRPMDKSWAGLMDMGGGVREWTGSRYAPYPGSDEAGDLTMRVSRGGSFMMVGAQFMTSHTRSADAPKTRRPDLGFRCAVTL